MADPLVRANLENSFSNNIIHTIGHSTRSIEAFIALLQLHRVEFLIDVRRWPMSRRYPHFGREALAASLQQSRIDYIWRQDLGGFRKPAPDSPNTAWRVATFRAYADFMLTDDFTRIAAEVEKFAADKRASFMCAEAVPWRCHRQLLADCFLVRGWQVRHIMDDGCHAHKLPDFARVTENQIVYSGPSRQSDDPNGRLF